MSLEDLHPEIALQLFESLPDFKSAVSLARTSRYFNQIWQVHCQPICRCILRHYVFPHRQIRDPEGPFLPLKARHLARMQWKYQNPGEYPQPALDAAKRVIRNGKTIEDALERMRAFNRQNPTQRIPKDHILMARTYGPVPDLHIIYKDWYAAYSRAHTSMVHVPHNDEFGKPVINSNGMYLLKQHDGFVLDFRLKTS